jgi:hypothetical protein
MTKPNFFLGNSIIVLASLVVFISALLLPYNPNFEGFTLSDPQVLIEKFPSSVSQSEVHEADNKVGLTDFISALNSDSLITGMPTGEPGRCAPVDDPTTQCFPPLDPELFFNDGRFCYEDEGACNFGDPFAQVGQYCEGGFDPFGNCLESPPSNNAPTWTQTITHPTVNEDSGSTIVDSDLTSSGNGQCTDSDGDLLTFSVSSHNTAEVSCSISSNSLSVTPASNWFGTASCTITCDDGNGGTADDTLSITVNSVNDAPVLTGIPDQTLSHTASLDNLIDLYSYHSDVDGSDAATTFTISSETDTSVVDCSIDSDRYVDCTYGDMIGSSDYSDITITATDAGSLTDTDTFRVTLTNTAPNVAGVAISPSSPSTDDDLTGSGILSDLDGDSITSIFDWRFSGTSFASLNLPFDTNPSSSTINDYTSYNNDFTKNGATWQNSATCGLTGSGGCMEFDGTNDRLTRADDSDFDSLTALSVCTWVYPHSWGGATTVDYIFDKRHGSSPWNSVALFFHGTGDKLRLDLGAIDGTNYVLDYDYNLANPAQQFPLNTWQFVCGTWDGPSTTMKIYYNGAEVSSTTSTFGGTLLNGNGPAVIGVLGDQFQHWYDGYMDNIQFYNKALSSQQISSMYGSGTPNYAVLVSEETNEADSITVTITPSDAIEDGTSSTSSASVVASNSAPVAAGASLAVDEDNTLSNTLSATDADSDPLTFSIVSQASNGVATITNSATGAFQYVPTANFNGADSFTFKANDGTADSNIETINILVNPVNDEPVLTSKLLSITGSSPYYTTETFTASATASDVDGDTVTFMYDYRFDGDSDRVLHLSFDTNTSENSTDYTSYSNDAIINTSGAYDSNIHPVWTSSGIKGGAYDFTNVDDHDAAHSSTNTLRIPWDESTYDLTQDLSICWWMYPTNIDPAGSTQDRQNPISKHYRAEFQFTLEPSASLNYYHGNSNPNGTTSIYNSNPVLSSGSVTENQWNFFCFVRDNTNKWVSGFLDGSLNRNETYDLIDSNDPSLGYREPNSGAGNTYYEDILIGDGYSNPFIGKIDEVMIWNKKISAEYILSMYNSGTPDYSVLVSQETRKGNYNVSVTPSDGTIDGSSGITNTIEIVNLAPTSSTPVLLASDDPDNKTTADLSVTNNLVEQDPEDTETRSFTEWFVDSVSTLEFFYTFFFNSTNAEDLSSNSANGTLSDINMYYGTGILDGAINFEQNSQYYVDLTANNFDLTNGKTLTFWYKLADTTTVNTGCYAPSSSQESCYGIFSSGSSGSWDNYLNIVLSGTNIATVQYELHDGSNHATPSFATDTNWHMIALSIESGSLNLYHDGIVIGAAPFEEGKRIDLSYLGMGYGGADDPPANGQFYGQLDEVSLFTRALQGEQILAMYNSGTPSYDEIVAEETLKGEDWSVEITPIDREDSGSTVTSNTVTIENTAPTTPSGSTLSPSTLKVGNTLTATGTGSTDADGDSLTYYYEFRSNSASGTILQAYSTTNTYTVSQSDSGTTIYVNIKANDGTDDSSAETVSKAVSNTAPTIIGTDITINGQEDTDLIFGTVNFTTSASYSDADGDAFAGIRITSAPTNGDLFNGATQLTGAGLQCNTASLGFCSAYNIFVSSSDIAAGNFKFVPDSNVNGAPAAAFGFNVYDGTEYSSGVGTSIVINLGSVNDAPVAVDDEYSLDSGNTLTVSASGVLTNDSDIDGDSLTTVLGVPPSGASSFTLNSDGSFTYVSDPTYSGATDSFTYRANDGSLNSNVANVTINLAKTISIALSNSLSTALTFSASQANAQFSGSGNDDYHVNLTANGTAANLSIKASGPLSDGGSNSIALSNFKYNYTGSSTPVALSTSETNTTKSFAGVLKQTFFEFFIDVPASQSAGTYTNTITFRGETL